MDKKTYKTITVNNYDDVAAFLNLNKDNSDFQLIKISEIVNGKVYVLYSE